MSRLLLTGIVLTAVACGTACSNVDMHESRDFERHTLSQLSAPLEGGDFYWFDVKLTAEMPADNEAAEARRMTWLSSWMAARSSCGAAYEVLERRPFDFLEHNPARFDLRYKVRCAPGSLSAGPT
jgi:hypothetical protein